MSLVSLKADPDDHTPVANQELTEKAKKFSAKHGVPFREALFAVERMNYTPDTPAGKTLIVSDLTMIVSLETGLSLSESLTYLKENLKDRSNPVMGLVFDEISSTLGLSKEDAHFWLESYLKNF